jgi:hypothetical protein
MVETQDLVFLEKQNRESELCSVSMEICILCGECLPAEEEDLESEQNSNYVRDAFDWRR